MIGKGCKYFCREDLCLIENYDKAINDTTQIWDCHHRLEIDLNLSREQMKERGLYYDRPAAELIFLTHEDHTSLHNLYKDFSCFRGESNPFYGHNHKAETKEHLRIKAKEQWSDSDARAMQHKRRHMNNGINRVFPTPEEFQYYLNNGYVFGFKLKDL